MKTTYSRQELLSVLEKASLYVKTFHKTAEGPYSVDDAIWNYRDAVAHLPHLHPQVMNVPIIVERNRIISLFFQKLFFLRFPITVVDQLSDKYTQTTFTNCFFFTLVVENKCRSLGKDRSEVCTTYTLGIPKLLFWAFPLLKWVILKNYKKLMSTDIPCRERRGELRKWGYRFSSDDHGFVEAQQIGMNNVVVPTNMVSDVPERKNEWPKTMEDGETVLIGRSDHKGLRLVRQGNTVLVFERLCLHEGASLDGAPVCKGKEIRCPWHGRVIRPLEVLSYEDLLSGKALPGLINWLSG